MAVNFKAGDKVEFVTDYPENIEFRRVRKGVQGVVKHVGYDTIQVEIPGRLGHESVFPRRLKHVVEAPFSVGDKVTVKGWETTKNPAWEGRSGTVRTVSSDYAVVDFDDRSERMYLSSGGFEFKYLVPAEKKLTFEDIQKGDKIRRTETYKSGAKEVREGTVAHKGSWYAEDENLMLAYDSDTGKATVTLELLERPEPVKEVWEDAKAGDVFKRVERDNTQSTVTRLEDGWLVTYAHGQNRVSVSSFDLASTHLLANETGRTVTKVS
jgi:hypothetical protein